MYRFNINRNRYLEMEITGYFHQYYTGYRQQDNPDFLNTLKNTFNTESRRNLIDARENVINILMHDISEIIRENNMPNCMCVCIPRAKALETYANSQLMFKEAVSVAANNLHGVIDGTDCIRRVVNTLTTHLRNAATIPNDGEEPYSGITVATCEIDTNRIMNQNIILIDDIYTRNVNIDEDCIQALLNNGARNVIFYSIGHTRRN